MKKNKNSEFRQDAVSGDWVLVASTRGHRPHIADQKKVFTPKTLLKNCPFEDPQKNGNPEPVLWYGFDQLKKDQKKKFKKKDWFVQVIPNKYPALIPSNICPVIKTNGHYKSMSGVGFHEVIITRPHAISLGEMNYDEAQLVLRAYQERYKILQKKKCTEYILIFHNNGHKAGATIEHPHSQIVALPITPPDVYRSFEGSRKYFKKRGRCVHCVMLDWELKKKERIIFQNDYFLVVAPFASRVSYEVRIYPKWHTSHFEKLDEKKHSWLAQALVEALHRLGVALSSPDYNFFIHTAPAQVRHMEYYHWHFEILPKTNTWAGLELGTGVEVLTTSPEMAAEELRNIP